MNNLTPPREMLTSGHGTVGHNHNSVQYDPHSVQNEQRIVEKNCKLNINTFTPNPFNVQPEQSTWNDNFLLLKDPRLRTLSGVAPLDRGFANSSKYNSSLHLKPCYTSES